MHHIATEIMWAYAYGNLARNSTIFDPLLEMDLRLLILDPDSRTPGFTPENVASC